MKSSVTPLRSSLRSGGCELLVLLLLLLYKGIFGIVGDRACAPRIPKAFSASVLLCRWGVMPLTDRSCRAADGTEGRALLEPRFATERELARDDWENRRGAATVRGVLPWGLLCCVSECQRKESTRGEEEVNTHSSRFRGRKRSSSLNGGERILSGARPP